MCQVGDDVLKCNRKRNFGGKISQATEQLMKQRKALRGSSVVKSALLLISICVV